MNKHQTVHLKGQHTFELEVELGLCNFSFKVIEGKIRINHCSYNPDGGTWLSAPNKGRQAHYNLSETNNETILSFSIENSYGKRDRIMIVNPSLFKRATFEFRSLGSSDNTTDNELHNS